MSIEAVAAVRSLPRQGVHLSPRDRFVLYALADYANHDNVAWPSYSTLSEWTGYDRSSVIRAINALEQAGLIVIEQRRRSNGSATSNMYRLPITTTRSFAAQPLPQGVVAQCD